MARAHEALASCRLCPWDCRVDRRRADFGKHGELGGFGKCGLGAEARVYKAFVHRGEERALIPSYTVYLTGCSLRCRFCSEQPIIEDPSQGRPLQDWPSREQLLAARAAGARNLHFVGGEPLVNLPGILAFLTQHAETCRGWPLVMNTNLYASPFGRDLLFELADVIVADLKWGNQGCALRLSKAPNYVSVVRENLRWLAAEGASLIVRHLLIPGHLDCCTRPILQAMQAWPTIPLNLMTAYVPFGASRSSGVEASMPTLSERRALIEQILALPEARSIRLWVDGEAP